MNRRDFFGMPLAGAIALDGLRFLGAAPSTFAAKDFPSAPGLTTNVAEFIVDTKFENIPEDVIALGKKSILDGFGLALAGSKSDLSPIARQYLKNLGFSGGKASIIGTNMKAPPRFAAFANGTSIHADDYDDTELISGDGVHATATVLPAVFAISEAERRTGKELMLAYHVGVEVDGKIAAAISPRHYADGFHATGTIGSFGSAAACAKLLGLNSLQTSQALGIVASEAAGVRDNFGTMTKPFHAGHAAENGIVAADLSSLGWTAATDILEAKGGYFQAAGGGFNPDAIMNRLGKTWAFNSPGILIKQFPCGTIQQPVMSEILRLVQMNKIKAADVDSVEVGGDQLSVNTLIRHHPTTGLEGKFSMEFCVSIIILDHKAVLSQFTDAAVQRPDVQALIPRVHYYHDPALENTRSGLVKIHLKNGQVLSSPAEFAKGHPKNPMSYEEVADKFRANAGFAKWPSQKAESVINLVKNLEDLTDISQLTAALVS